jgi:hypothetical protein
MGGGWGALMRVLIRERRPKTHPANLGAAFPRASPVMNNGMKAKQCKLSAACACAPAVHGDSHLSLPEKELLEAARTSRKNNCSNRGRFAACTPRQKQQITLVNARCSSAQHRGYMQALLTANEIKIKHALNRFLLPIEEDRLRLRAEQLPEEHFGRHAQLRGRSGPNCLYD